MLAVSVPVDAQVGDGNPYQAIVSHNAFALKPATAVVVSSTETPPSEITLNGITTIFGDKRALFKVQPPSPAGQQSYFLSEGERADDLELLSVDVRASKIKINNHGIIQTIALCPPPNLSTLVAVGALSGRVNGVNIPGYQGIPTTGAFTADGGTVPRVATGQLNSPGLAGGAGMPGSYVNNNSGTGQPNAGNSGSQNNDGSGLQNSGSPASPNADPATSSSDTANAGGQKSEPYAIRAARDFEQIRLQTANAVLSGAADPLPLTPLTPPGTPLALIGPGQAWFND